MQSSFTASGRCPYPESYIYLILQYITEQFRIKVGAAGRIWTPEDQRLKHSVPTAKPQV